MHYRLQRGFTLTELLVALVINIFIFSTLLMIITTNVTNYYSTVNINLLNSQLQTALDMMAMDIRRAGYWANASNDIGNDTNTNPFMSTSAGTDVSVGASNSCILFTYDRNKNGVLPGINNSSDDERYGYRLSGNAIQTRPWGATFACNAANNVWENVTDPTFINITNLTFTLTTKTVSGPRTSTFNMRSVDISVTGSLVNDATITRTLTQHVRIRNDKFSP